jgi:hypothetical protein
MFKELLLHHLVAWQHNMMADTFPDGEVWINFLYRRKKKYWRVIVRLDLGHPEHDGCETWIYTRDEHGEKVSQEAFLTEVLAAMESMTANLLRDTGRDKLGANYA